MASAHWIFGYGSLIWRQDFPFLAARQASVSGWARRFWQGSHDHRGVATAPGRVVTLVQAPGERCHGRAFLIEAEVLEHLDHRERNGYERHELEIEFADATAEGIVYIAPPGNFAFLGDAPLDDLVSQIRSSSGASGSNRDYVLELARALRELEISDEHVFRIESRLLEPTGNETNG